VALPVQVMGRSYAGEPDGDIEGHAQRAEKQTAMCRWEYLTFNIPYDSKQKDWAIQPAGSGALVGIQTILRTHGAQGWELVSMQAEYSRLYPNFGNWGPEPDTYRVTFKRPIAV